MRANMALYGSPQTLSEDEALRCYPGTSVAAGPDRRPGDESDRFTYRAGAHRRRRRSAGPAA